MLSNHRWLIGVALATAMLSLPGCASSDEDLYLACKNYGHKPGTTAIAACVESSRRLEKIQNDGIRRAFLGPQNESDEKR